MAALGKADESPIAGWADSASGWVKPAETFRRVSLWYLPMHTLPAIWYRWMVAENFLARKLEKRSFPSNASTHLNPCISMTYGFDCAAFDPVAIARFEERIGIDQRLLKQWQGPALGDDKQRFIGPNNLGSLYADRRQNCSCLDKLDLRTADYDNACPAFRQIAPAPTSID